jgi:hypothetical protein
VLTIFSCCKYAKQDFISTKKARLILLHLLFYRFFQANNSESSSEEAPIHFTATVEGETRGPGGIGSYLARQEFGSNEGPPANGAADSGYVSHSSGGHYPRWRMHYFSYSHSFSFVSFYFV